ncbi:MAG: pirin family protein [Bacteroidota bacterium]
MLTVRQATQRGRTRIDWLDSRHTFSFGDYHDPAAMGFRVLRVLNDDRVAAGGGFPNHGHRDMEIISYVLAGALAHEDSLGTGSVIKPGDVQRMSAGTGVRHSEFNASPSEPVHFLQIWILPERAGLPAGYEQKTFADAEKRDRFRVVASPDGRDGSLTIRQDATMSVALVAAGGRAVHALAPGRHAYLHVARGAVTVAGQRLNEGDGAAISDQPSVEVVGGPGDGAGDGDGDSEVLLFDLP